MAPLYKHYRSVGQMPWPLGWGTWYPVHSHGQYYSIPRWGAFIVCVLRRADVEQWRPKKHTVMTPKAHIDTHTHTPDTVFALNICQLLTPQGRCYPCPHFTDGETEAQRIVALGEIVPEVVQLVNYRAGQWDLEGQWFSVGLFLPGACASW